MTNIPMISIVEDDELVRDAVGNLVRSFGYAAATHTSGEDYLSSDEHWTSSCVIADIQMHGMSGADLQALLIAEGNPTPIIFMTGFDDEQMRTRVLQAGALGYLKKPIDDIALMECLEKALSSRNPVCYSTKE
ncbi:MAG TPA: response regulator [Pyrinomonadaceae bacterium]|nr:response regulator [Pyrinomonadaceae bacterium]